MMRKLVLISVLALAFGTAGEYLVRVDLDQDRLIPISENGLNVLAELEGSAIVLLEEDELSKMQSLDYRIMAAQPREGDYYLVLPMDQNINLTAYGDILMQDGSDFLLKLYLGTMESLAGQKVMIKRLSFTPMILAKPEEPQYPESTTQLPDVVFNYTVQEMVDLVDGDTILGNVQRFQDYITRYSTHDSCFAAAAYISDKFIAYGCDSVFLQYHETGYAPNVVGVKHGQVYPDSIYTVICGHFDATSYLAPSIAPGADDNASGTAAVLEAARVMQNYNFEYS
ncbi:MAG: M28 family peptidase, partial [candidate division WOR-3 bacterium]